MDRKILGLQKEYLQGTLDRRGFLKELARIAGGVGAALALLPSLEQNRLAAQAVPADDPRLRAEMIQYPAAAGAMRAYLAQLKTDARRPAVVVIHENRGLNAHTEEVARRLALEGFLALAPDALSPLGGTPENPDDARALMQKLDRQQTVQNFVAAVAYLQTRPRATGKVGCIGFCWGGGMTNQVAIHSPDLKAAVPFYGSPPAPEDVPKIKAPLLLHYAGNDERINAGIPAFEAALKQAGIEYKLFLYEGAGHAFFNDTNPSRYNAEAARLSWERTIAFLKEKLQT